MSMAHDMFIASQQQLNAVPIKIDLQTTALVIIDMQEYFLNPASPLGRFGEKRMPGLRHYFLEQGATVVIPNLRRLLECFRTQHLRVIHATAASELPDGQDWIPTLHQTNMVAQEQIGEVVYPARTDPWARIVAPLTPRPEEVIVNKTTYSAFTATSLDGLLRNLRIETLVLGGVVTNRCVETTARDATDRGYQVIVLGDATATYSPEAQEATLLSLEGAYGYVRTTDEVVALLKQALPGRAL
jgi:nicotinamidase-related amidase